MPPSRRADALLLGAFLLVTAWLAREHFARSIDPENRGMRSVGTPVARDLEQKERLFGRESDVVLLLEPEAPVEAGARERLQALADRLPELEVVRGVRTLPLEEEGALLVSLDLAAAPDGGFGASLETLREHVRAELPARTRLSVTGGPAAEAAIARALDGESRRIVPVIVGLLLALLLAVYGDLVPTLGVLGAALGGLFWMGGLQELLGIPLDPISSLLPVALLAIGVAASVHLLERYRANLRRGRSVPEAVREAVRALRRPMVLTTTTTMAGFVGLATNPIPSVQRFAWLAALGVGVTCGLTVVVLPAWLRLLHRPRAASWRRPVTGPITRLVRSTRAGVTRPLLSVSLGLGASALLGLAGTRLAVDTDPLRVLPRGDSFREETERVAEVLGGRATLDVLLPPPQPGFGAAGLLLEIGKLARTPGVTRLAGTPRTAEDGTRLVRFLVDAPDGGLAGVAGELERHARELGWEAPVVTGGLLQVELDSRALVHGQLRSVGVTLALLLVAVAVGFRSLSIGLVALLPNVVPCVVVYGALELLGRPLTVANSMIGSVMLGLIVDDTIHFLHAYRHARTEGPGRAAAAGAALDSVGHALVATSLVLSAGFAAGLLGELDSTREFSLLSAATIGAALLANLLLLPALLVLPDSLRRLLPAPAGGADDRDTTTEPCEPKRITTS